jgi:hypothetical protein
VFDVGELDLLAEVDLAECFAGEGTQLLLAGAGVLGVEEAGRVLRGRGQVRWRMRASSVVLGAAVKPNRARASTTRPVLVAAWRRARSRTRGCQRSRTAASKRWARSARGRDAGVDLAAAAAG